MNDAPRVIEGSLVVDGNTRFAILASRFNSFIVERLVDGAIDTLVRHGADAKKITIIRVPGAWELPLVCKRVAAAGGVDAIVALGALIRGATAHFDYIAGAVTKGLGQISLDSGVPVAFGVLTTDTLEQAIERAGSKAGNKGAEAALAAIELVSLFQKLDA
ncbi:MAG: 6,7-dimethyl-8-ribityllumazine synthase [Myxococcales bacterium]|nr:6,7-dimethyl-8-ribityllumazine synthase [Myxococcales bacterium]